LPKYNSIYQQANYTSVATRARLGYYAMVTNRLILFSEGPMRIKWRDKNKRDGYFAPDDEIAKDGEVVRTPMMLFDAATGARRPGYATLSDQQLADRNAARREFIDRAEQAWRGPGKVAAFQSGTLPDARRKRPPDDDEDNDDEPDFGASVEKDKARDAYVESLRDAWRSKLTSEPPRPNARPPTRDASKPPDRSTRPDEAEREKEYAKRKADLENAWRGATNPQRAPAVERQLEQWKGGR
jgi:hypothetical protein